jgi:hypothetical protein
VLANPGLRKSAPIGRLFVNFYRAHSVGECQALANRWGPD